MTPLKNPLELTPLQRARYGAWLLNAGFQQMLAEYKPAPQALACLLLEVNMTHRAFTYDPDLIPGPELDSPPRDIDPDPEVFAQLKELYQAKLLRLERGEDPPLQPFKDLTARTWLAEAGRCATYTAARLREHQEEQTAALAASAAAELQPPTTPTADAGPKPPRPRRRAPAKPRKPRKTPPAAEPE